jgi:sporulation protein YabP
MTVDGVKDVVEFDETLVRLLTDGGDMTVEGSELHVKVLDVERAVVALEGKIDGVFYSDSDGGEKKSFWERFLK